MGRFCEIECPQLERLLENALGRLSSEIRADSRSECLRFLCLGGGYGRGEGGCIKNSDGSYSLSNDLDFFPVCSESATAQQIAALGDLLAQMSKRLCVQLGIDADFCAPKKVSYIANRLGVMMWRDFAGGSQIVVGDAAEFAALFPVSKIPLKLSAWEGVKLLFNRAYGLILAKRRIDNNDTSGDFVHRNINKAFLALGDFAILMSGNIPIQIKDRLAILDNLKAPSGCEKLYADIRQTYASACLQKFSPTPSENPQILIENWTKAEFLLTNITMHFMPILKTDYEPPIKTVKNIVRNIVLHKDFKSANARCRLMINPLISGIEAELKFLKSKPSDNGFKIIKRIWDKLN